nr:hypothetical protein [uncultured Rhodoferax sp.]
MTNQDTPHNGDFASFLEGKTKNAQAPATAGLDVPPAAELTATRPRQTVEDVLVHGETPTEEFLEEWNELESLPELSDEELAQQALNAPGDDGDITTPE